MATSRLVLAFAFLALADFVLAAQGPPMTAQTAPLPPDRIVQKADELVMTAGSSRVVELELAGPGGAKLAYRFKCWIRDGRTQRMSFEEPSFDRGDSALRSGDRLYFEYREWPRFDTMSSRANFLDSPLSWDDVLGLGLATSYEVASTSADDSSGGRFLKLGLRPRAGGVYRRIDLVVDPSTWRTANRTYYSPSGKPWKTMRFKDWTPGAAGTGALPGFTIEVSDELTGARAVMKVGRGRLESMPSAFFEPADLSKGNQR